MATKKILGIDVQVNDADFKRLEEAFNAWDIKLQELPKHWDDLGKAMGNGFSLLHNSLGEITKHLETIAQHSGSVTRAINDADQAQIAFGNSTSRAGHAMKSLASETKGVLTSVLQLGRFLGFGGVLAGLGSGLGIFALANSATNRSRTAGGVGLSPGQLSAFNANLGPFIGSPQGFLSSVSNAQLDLQQRGTLLAASGLTGQQIGAENPEQIALAVINRARGEVRRTGNLNGPAASAAQHLGLSGSDLRNLASLNGAELKNYERHALGDAGRLGFGQQTAADWRKLDVALREAGVQIESTLIKGLAPLAGPLGHLSHALVHGIGEVLASKGFREGINEAATGIEHLGKYLSSDAFGKDLKGLEGVIKTLADNAKAAAIALGVLAGISAADKIRKLAGVAGGAAGLGADVAASAAGAGMLGLGGAALAAGAIAFWPSHLGNDEIGASGADLKKRRGAIGILAAEYRKAGLGQAAISGLIGNGLWEGNLNPHQKQIGGGGGFGIFQWDKARRADFTKMFGHSMRSATVEEEGAFSIWELKHNFPDVWGKLKSGKLDVQQAAKIVEQGYLKPADANNPTGSIIHRTAEAQQINAILSANRMQPHGMGTSSRSAPIPNQGIDPTNHDQLVGLLKSIDRKMSSPSARISITNNSAARVNVQANAAAR